MKLVEQYYPDLLIQFGVFVLAMNAYSTCRTHIVYGLTCEYDYLAVTAAIMVSGGLNILIRRILKRQ